MQGSTRPIIFKEETDSTNKELWQMADSGTQIPEGLVLWTNNQQAGRGMGGTTWHSKAGRNLTCSFFLKPVFLEPAKQFILNKCIAVSISATLQQIAPKHAFGIKWPNDIYHANKKISGTLIENRIQGQEYACCVAGIGININQVSFPENIPNPTSLALITGSQASIEICLTQLQDNLYHFYENLKKGRFNIINQLYLDNMLGYGRRMKFKENDIIFDATIEGVNDYGKLILKSGPNTTREYGMKEIEFLF